MVVNERVLSQIRGVIHVGANTGQERDIYAAHNLNALWFEPNPEAFRTLQHNIQGFPKQTAYQFLLADKDDQMVLLHVTNGAAQASSIFDMGKQLEFYPKFTYVRDVAVLSLTLDTFMKESETCWNDFQFLVLDTQGADLLVLKGAVHTLQHMRFVEVETSPWEMYKGCCLEQEVIDFMATQGFKETGRTVVNPGIDNHILFEKV